MQLLRQFVCLCSLGNKISDKVKFCSVTSFKSRGVMKDKSWVAFEYQFVLDIMKASLHHKEI